MWSLCSREYLRRAYRRKWTKKERNMKLHSLINNVTESQSYLQSLAASLLSWRNPILLLKRACTRVIRNFKSYVVITEISFNRFNMICLQLVSSLFAAVILFVFVACHHRLQPRILLGFSIVLFIGISSTQEEWDETKHEKLKALYCPWTLAD